LRSILAFTVGAGEGSPRVSELDIDVAIAKRRKKTDWEVILPDVAQLRLSTDGGGIPITMRISKDGELAVRVAKPGEEVSGTVVKHHVDPWDVYTMSRDDLAGKLGLTGPRTHALIFELALQNDPDCYKELKRKSQVYNGYSKKALELLRVAKGELDIETIWQKHRAKLVPNTKRAG